MTNGHEMLLQVDQEKIIKKKQFSIGIVFLLQAKNDSFCINWSAWAFVTKGLSDIIASRGCEQIRGCIY